MSYAQTVSGSCRIDMRFMLRNKCIVKNAETWGALSWTDGETINFRCRVTNTEKYLRLMYTVTERNGQQIDYNYKIYIDEVSSNLGKGTILYFLCPESGKRSRILCMAYSENKFINREYYLNKHGLRIYYGCQKTSKIDYHNTRYFDLKRKVDKLECELNEKHRNTHYRGMQTKEQSQLLRLKIKMEYHNLRRLEILRKKLNL